MPLLRLDDLSKSYGEVRAVRGVSLAFEPGKVHAVVGENGAGKSTLLKMAAGIVTPDSGNVNVDGARIEPHTAAAAISRGVAMVQQHFALIGVFSAIENVMLGAEPVTSLGRLDVPRAREKVGAILRDLGASFSLDAPVETLGIGDQQRLEIARALYKDAKVLILDEPTAVLTPGEADALYATLRRLADDARTIVVVTHKLDEVRDHADVVSVMRRGELVVTKALARGDTDAVRTIAEAIMGGAVADPIGRRDPKIGDVRLRIEGARKDPVLRGASISVRAGEIVGVAGVEGNGQRELVRALGGLDVLDGGSIEGGPVAVVYEDRQTDGLVLDASVADNLILGELARFSRAGWLDVAAIDREAHARLVAAAIVPADDGLPARALSGGNQQKIVVARAMARTRTEAKVLVVAHPTRGVDFNASRAIQSALVEAASRGVAILVISADLNELRALCDRIVVMTRGAIVAEMPPTATDRELGAAMLGTSAS